MIDYSKSSRESLENRLADLEYKLKYETETWWDRWKIKSEMKLVQSYLDSM